MKVLYYALIELELSEGPSVHTLNMLKGLQSCGAETTLVCPRPRHAQAEYPPGRTVTVPFFGFDGWRYLIYDFLCLITLLRTILDVKPDVIYAREEEGHLAVLVAALLTRTPLIIDNNGPFKMDFQVLGGSEDLGIPKPSGLGKMLGKLWRFAWRSFQFMTARGMTFNSQTWCEHLCKEYGYPPEQALPLTMFVDTECFYPMNAAEVRKKYKIPGSSAVLGYVGSFQPAHATEILLDAAEILNRVHYPVTLLFVGGGRRMEALAAKVRSRRLEDVCRFTGWLPHHEIPEIINACTLGSALMKPIKDYQTENLLKVKEFLACGVPVLVDCSADAFKDFPASAIVRASHEDAQALADRIAAFLNQPGVVAKERIAFYIAEHYSLKAGAEQLLRFMKKLL